MSLSNKNQIAQVLVKYFSTFLVLSLLLITSLSAYFLLWPKYKEIKEQEILSFDQKKEELATKQQELAALKDLDNQLKQISEQEVERLAKLLPMGVDNPAIFRQMEKLAQDNNLVLTSVSISEGGTKSSGESSARGGSAFGGETAGEASVVTNEEGEVIANTVRAAPVENSQLKTLTINVAFTGDQDYEKFKKVLANIENNLMILDPTSLAYSPAQSGYSFNFLTYYLPATK